MEAEKVTTTEPETTEEKEEEVEYLIETTTREDFINCACNALNAVSESNPMTKADTVHQREIQSMCLKIIGKYVKEMYDESFEEEED